MQAACEGGGGVARATRNWSDQAQGFIAVPLVGATFCAKRAAWLTKKIIHLDPIHEKYMESNKIDQGLSRARLTLDRRRLPSSTHAVDAYIRPAPDAACNAAITSVLITTCVAIALSRLGFGPRRLAASDNQQRRCCLIGNIARACLGSGGPTRAGARSIFCVGATPGTCPGRPCYRYEPFPRLFRSVGTLCADGRPPFMMTSFSLHFGPCC